VKDATDRLFYMGAGPIAAIFLGALLVLVRDWTTASNFSFVFLALIIAVAEFGGSAAAIGTAVASTLSLDFFLTQPYLRLSIADKGDLIACVGLAACGLLAARLADRRPGSEALREVSAIRAVLDALGGKGSLEERLNEAARLCRDQLQLVAVVVRDDRDHVVGSSSNTDGLKPLPATVLKGAARLREARGQGATAPWPTDGARIPLAAAGRQVGWLDLWGDGAPAEIGEWQAVGDIATALGISIAQVS
jgi:K+-sensing histidine kinase KdpD